MTEIESNAINIPVGVALSDYPRGPSKTTSCLAIIMSAGVNPFMFTFVRSAPLSFNSCRISASEKGLVGVTQCGTWKREKILPTHLVHILMK